MKKTNHISIVLVVGGALLAGSIDASTSIKSTSSSSAQGQSQTDKLWWAQHYIKEYPEILYLGSAEVRKTEEGEPSSQGSYSEKLCGQKYIEFDRTLMTLHCLECILDGSKDAYDTFTKAQPKETRLSKESFQDLHHLGQRLLKSGWGGMSPLQMAKTMETALALGDIGKSERARELFKPYGVSAPDHDDFHEELLPVLAKHPELSPSFAKLPEAGRQLLLKIHLAHYGHITHLEGGLSMYDKLKQSQVPSKDPIALDFDLFVHICDIAGALGHLNNESSLVYTEPSHRAMQAVAESVRVLAHPEATTWDAYNTYLTIRASWLGLNPQDRFDRVLTRIGTMLRLFTPEEGIILKTALLKLEAQDQDRITAQLDVQKGEEIGRTPTYIPALLINLLNNPQLGVSKEERLMQTVFIGLPFISRVLEMHKGQISKQKYDPMIPLNFNKMAGVAKTAPQNLHQECRIDPEGNVSLVVK